MIRNIIIVVFLQPIPGVQTRIVWETSTPTSKEKKKKTMIGQLCEVLCFLIKHHPTKKKKKEKKKKRETNQKQNPKSYWVE